MYREDNWQIITLTRLKSQIFDEQIERIQLLYRHHRIVY